MKRPYTLVIALTFLAACAAPPPERLWRNMEKSLQTQLITAMSGDTIDLPEGNFMFSRSLTLDAKSNITIRGKGMDKTILSWRNQTEGAQGFLVSNSRNITLEDFSLEDAKGDNLKINDTNGITLRRIRSVWSDGPKTENGAYALYPVLCKNVLMEQCIAMGSSDAGIYVGQSDSVIIRNNTAYWNVAGIEAENSRWVEIYGNEAYDNTGGLLIFDLPGLTQYGHATRAYDNRIHDNNLSNFAQEGNIVASIPPGTGVMILATHDVQLHDNEIKDNRTVGVAILSYELVAALNEGVEEQPNAMGGVQTVNNRFREDSLYNPFPYDVSVFRNRVSTSYWFPSVANDIGKLLIWHSPFTPPALIYDGIEDPARPQRNICFSDNGEIRFVNLDAGNDFKSLSMDPKPFACSPGKSGLKP
jgi:parallel beta-helix repeat protein